MSDLKKIFYENPYRGYAYSYPHKSAYRNFDRPLSLDEIWKDEDINNLFLYLHLPFCSNKCSYCNLFSIVENDADYINNYMKAVEKQIAAINDSPLSSGIYSQIAIGGGTPTLLDVKMLESMFKMIDGISSYLSKDIPLSFELSPDTISLEKLAVMKNYNVKRASIGVQSFDKKLLEYFGRRLSYDHLHPILDMISKTCFENFNIDLIYGGDPFDLNGWEKTLKDTVAYGPDEIYLYPLYVRKGTSLFEKKEKIDLRFRSYLYAKNFLLSEGYVQVSKRRFDRKERTVNSLSEYSCQKNGMVGLGCGSRSYTEKIHYSTRYSNKSENVKNIIDDYIKKDKASFSKIDYGFFMDREDSMRRYLIKSILRKEGLDRKDFMKEFTTDALDAFIELTSLSDNGLTTMTDDRIALTDEGIDLSDAIGQWLYSARVRKLMDEDAD